MPTAIEFENVSKQYRLGFVSTRTLAADLNRWWTMNIRGKEDTYLKIGSIKELSIVTDCEYIGTIYNIDFKELRHYCDLTTIIIKRNNISAMTTKYRDLQVLFSVIVSLWMYATHIVYPLNLVKGKVIGCGWLAHSFAFMSLTLFLGITVFIRVKKSFMDTV